MNLLPKEIDKVVVPPIKTQGIKTKLVQFILSNILWKGEGRWVEPFLGSGVVLFNVQPRKALISDTNPHIIQFYKDIYDNIISPNIVREYLEVEGDKLLKHGEEYYYEVRNRFNQKHNSLDFLFLNRASFNGLMRFNSKGEFNVPFCRKTDRFRKAYITKIVNQVSAVKAVMLYRDWEFRVAPWQNIFPLIQETDFVYMDPPYIGRYSDYFTRWSDIEAASLAQHSRHLPCGFALSMWKENKYRKNTHLELWSTFTEERTYAHYYHIGATESLRNSIIEVLLIKKGYAAQPEKKRQTTKIYQPPLFMNR